MRPRPDGSAGGGAGGPALFVVATPIGNLEDVTLRALRVLREVDVVLCEDTRRTLTLLDRHGITKSLQSVHRFNEEKIAEQVIERLRDGRSAAYVTDGGTPAVSDPGARLVENVRRAGFPVVAVPGASAVTAAMSVAGWEGGFLFAGFVERREAARRGQIEEALRLPWASVFFEAPSRVQETLRTIDAVCGDRPILMAREMTKLHEQVLKAPARNVLAALDVNVRGEIVLVVFPGGGGRREVLPAGADLGRVLRACREMTAAGVKPMKAAAIAAALTGIPKKTLVSLLVSSPRS